MILENGINNVRIFENAEFGKVRTLIIDNEPYFVGKDVAEILGYSNSKDALIKHIDEEDKRILKGSDLRPLENHIPKTVFSVDFISADIPNRGLSIINESGLYSLILSSKLPGAKKFKHWVTSEALPSIRKNGAYIDNQENLSDAEIMAKGLLAAQNIINQKNQQILKMEQEVKIAEEKLIEQKPDVEFSKKIQSTNNVLKVSEIAKILELGYGGNILYKKLVELKILMPNHQPYQRFVNEKMFKVCVTYHEEKERIVAGKTTKVYMKGAFYIAKKLGVLNHEKEIYEAYEVPEEQIA